MGLKKCASWLECYHVPCAPAPCRLTEDVQHKFIILEELEGFVGHEDLMSKYTAFSIKEDGNFELTPEMNA